MTTEIPEKAKAGVAAAAAMLSAYYGTLCPVEIPSMSGSVPPEKYKAHIFDWFAFAESTREQFTSIYCVPQNKPDNEKWFFPIAIIPYRGVIAWYEKGEIGDRFAAVPKEAPDRLARTLLMNHPMAFLLCEAVSGAVHMAEGGNGVKRAKSISELNIKKGKKPSRA